MQYITFRLEGSKPFNTFEVARDLIVWMKEHHWEVDY